jgi:serine protease Do
MVRAPPEAGRLYQEPPCATVVACKSQVTRENLVDVLNSLQTAIATAAERVGPSVVGLGRGWGLGSGVVIGGGRVLTNARNLRREQVTVAFADGRRATAEVAGADPDLDLAVLAVDTGDAPAIAWEPADPPSLGTAVLALANPGGRGLRVTLGFVSSEDRSFRGPRGRRIRGAIEHTAALPRGSSGGPLVDGEGRLLGLNALRLDGGLILAVPATAAVKERASRLGRGEAPQTPRLGVAVAPPRVARRMRRAVGLPARDGALVRSVADGSPAAAAGIERGDLIVSVAGHPLERIDVLYEALDSASPGDRIDLGVLRGTDERNITVELQPQAEEVAT